MQCLSFLAVCAALVLTGYLFFQFVLFSTMEQDRVYLLLTEKKGVFPYLEYLALAHGW